MSKLYCRQSSQFLPIFTELEDLRSTCIANCVFNIFLSYTAFILNIATIYAIHKTSTMPKTLKTLLIGLACLDVAVGLFSQSLYTTFLINWLRLDNPSCNIQQVRTISSSCLVPWCCGCKCRQALSCSSSSQIPRACDSQACCYYCDWHMAMVYSVFVSLMILWGLLSTRDLVGTINFAFSFIITFVVYIKIYLTVRRHKNHTQSMQIRNEA